MAAKLHRVPTINAFSTSLNGAITDSDTSMTLTSVTGLDTAGGILAIDRVNAGGTPTSSQREFVSYTGITTLTLTGLTRGLAGSTAQAHSSGAVVEALWSVTHVIDLIDFLEVSHASNGTIKSGATLTSPVINTSISGTAIDTDGTLAANSDTKLASQKAVKTYVNTATRSIVLPAGSWSPTTTAGCASATVEAGTNDVDYKVLDFDKDTDESAFIVFAMPDSWDGGTITFIPYWTTAGTTGTACFSLAGRAYANDDAIDQAYGTPQTSTDTFLLAGDVHIGPASSAITLAGTPAGGQLVQLKITRDVSEDTLDADARLIAVKIEYKTGQYSD